MSKERIFLSSPHMSGLEKDYIEDAFRTNWISPLGPHVSAFEQETADYVGVKGGVALNSGSSALHLALKLTGVEPGDVVFCSSLTFVASANPILYLGAEPVFIDSEPGSWNMCPDALRRAFENAVRLNKLPKAVVVVNIYGQSADFEKIKPLADQYNVPIIEDAAESFGAFYNNKPSGSFGDFSILSFNGNKMITTSGGGMLLSNNQKALEKARFWSTQAREPVLHYEHKEVGYNYRLSNILAGIGRGQLRVLTDRVEARRRVFERYRQELSPVSGIDFMPEMKNSRSSRWLTVMTLDPSTIKPSVNYLINQLSKEDIEARPAWKPLHLQPLFQKCLFFPHHTGDVAQSLFHKGICLPSGSNLTDAQQSKVLSIIHSVLKS
ncbi:DegT/DnrJ/EryC1/StrS family aminotransferase [Halobacillus halophilus]|uniref:DegT/DnrJ/EryC1/StrS family aminotransferase n=1 Tax=Halobacillus halophilus TaxID=1570 RepID=UPI0039905FAA